LFIQSDSSFRDWQKHGATGNYVETFRIIRIVAHLLILYGGIDNDPLQTVPSYIL